MISRPIKEGFRGVGRHWSTAMTSAIAVTFVLVIISVLGILFFNIQNFTKNIETSLDIYAGVDYDYEDQESSLKKQIEAIDGVKTVTYSSKDAEFDYYIDSFSDQETKDAFEPFRDDNPMHDAYYIETETGDDIETVANALNKIDGLIDISYGGQSTINLVEAMNTIRWGGGILVIVLTLIAAFFIQNTIKLAIYARQDEITIMRNVGAKNSFIRSPFVMEGAIIGVMGAIIPIALTAWGYYYLYNLTGGTVISNMFHMIVPWPFVLYLCLGLLGIGIVVGLFGSYISVTKYLKVKR